MYALNPTQQLDSGRMRIRNNLGRDSHLIRNMRKEHRVREKSLELAHGIIR